MPITASVRAGIGLLQTGQFWKRSAVTVWLAAQFAVVGYITWLSEVRGVHDHHLGFLLIPTFGVLLFPGVQAVFVALAAIFWVAEAIGAPIGIPNAWVSHLMSLSVWALSACLMYLFWTWAFPRIWAAFGSMVKEDPSGP